MILKQNTWSRFSSQDMVFGSLTYWRRSSRCSFGGRLFSFFRSGFGCDLFLCDFFLGRRFLLQCFLCGFRRLFLGRSLFLSFFRLQRFCFLFLFCFCHRMKLLTGIGRKGYFLFNFELCFFVLWYRGTYTDTSPSIMAWHASRSKVIWETFPMSRVSGPSGGAMLEFNP